MLCRHRHPPPSAHRTRLSFPHPPAPSAPSVLLPRCAPHPILILRLACAAPVLFACLPVYFCLVTILLVHVHVLCYAVIVIPLHPHVVLVCHSPGLLPRCAPHPILILKRAFTTPLLFNGGFSYLLEVCQFVVVDYLLVSFVFMLGV